MCSVGATQFGCVRAGALHKNKVHVILVKYDHRPLAHSLFSKLRLLWRSQTDLSDTDGISVDMHTDAGEMAAKYTTR